MQANNNNNENNKSAKEESDEIIEILNSYRKKHEEPISPEKSNKKTLNESTVNNINTESKEAPQAILSHFVENGQDENDSSSQNPHLSNKTNADNIKNVQILNKNERFKKEKKPAKKFFDTLGKSSFLFKALFYIFFVLLFSAYLSYYAITIGNDVFALVKDKTNVIIKINDGATIDQVTDKLVENDVVDYGWAFKLYLNYRSDEDYKFVTGDHELSASMNYSKLINNLTIKPTDRVSARIVIPEGYTVDQIIELFLQSGIGTREGFVDAINNYDYEWEFVQALEKIGYSKDRKYRLEGYLFPDTYDFYVDIEEVMVINKLLDNFDDKFWSEYESEYLEICNEYDLTFDDIITLASMVEAEGNNAEDFEYISQVFHNRLKIPKVLPFLQSDATIQYVLPEREKDLTESDKALKNPYNTYEFKGLPPGSICNPGLDAISAALDPSEPIAKVKAYFFVSNDAGKTYYANKNKEHAENKKQVDEDNIAIKAGTYNG